MKKLTDRIRQYNIAAFFIITFAITWGLGFTNHVSINVPMAIRTPIFMLPVPIVISSAYSRVPSVKRYLVPLIRLRGVWSWALLALVVMPGLILLSIVMSSITGRQ